MQNVHFVFGEGIDNQKTAIVNEQGLSYTYAQLETKAERLISIVPSRSLVLFLCDRDLETVSLYYCLLYNRVVPIMMEPNISHDALQRVIDTYKPEFIWTNPDHHILGKEQYREGKHTLVQTGYGASEFYKDLALLLSTSGSTGSEKLVRISYKDLNENIAANVRKYKFCEADVGVTSLPINYCYGLSVLHYHWSVGGTVLVMGYSMIDELYWNSLEKYKVTTIQAVPYNFTIMRRMDLKQYDFHLRAVIFAGAKMFYEDCIAAYSFFQNIGVNYCIAYGQTETVSILCGLENEEILQKKNSIGKPFEGITVRLDTKDGELIVTGNSVSMGYAYERNDLSLADTNKGETRTGDCARIDSEGYIYLEGRKKRFLKIMGIRYSLEEMEELLQKQFKNRDIICGGMDNLLKIFVVGETDQTDILNFCVNQFSVNKKLMQVVHINEVPRNSSGKIVYSKLL